MAQCQSLLPILPPQVFCHCFFVFGTAALHVPSGGSAVSHKKNSLWGFKKCAIMLHPGTTPKRNTGVSFSRKCKLKMPYSTGQYTSDLTINISNITITVLLILFTLQLHTHTTFGYS